jgi:hypothetical protein
LPSSPFKSNNTNADEIETSVDVLGIDGSSTPIPSFFFFPDEDEDDELEPFF